MIYFIQYQIKKKINNIFWKIFNKILYPFSKHGIVNTISGGIDSRLFIELLSKYPKRIFGKYSILIINHNLQKSSTKESLNIVNMSKILGFSSFSVNVNNEYIFLKKNENFLRFKRYKIIWNIISFLKYHSLSTAHTQNDSIESYLMYQVGWGRSMFFPIIRKTQKGYILRPFLYFNRNQIKNILTIMGIFNYFQDISNLKNFYKRSWLRIHIMNFLYKIKNCNLFRFNYITEYLYSVKNYFNKHIVIKKKKLYFFIISNVYTFLKKNYLFKILYSLYFKHNNNNLNYQNMVLKICTEINTQNFFFFASDRFKGKK